MIHAKFFLACLFFAAPVTPDQPVHPDAIAPGNTQSPDDRPVTTDEEFPPGVIPAELEMNAWADSVWHGPFHRQMSGRWQLTWDDSVNGQLDREDKSCTLKLKEIDGKVTGEFQGPVAGSIRDAIITGRFEGSGTTRIIHFAQREPGYVCSYQAIDSGGEIIGVWHDTHNRSGEFRLLKYQ